jgi:serine/threonine protein kinase
MANARVGCTSDTVLRSNPAHPRSNLPDASALRASTEMASNTGTPNFSIRQSIDGDIVDETEPPYDNVRYLGHGHSGAVDEVRDRTTGKRYARKTIRLAGTIYNKAHATEVFQNEVKIILGLERHHHIIRVHTTYITLRDLGILLEPVAREGDLDEYMADYERSIHSSPISTPRVVAMTAVLEKGFGCLTAGLAFMHKKRIRHKDIKPRNILVHEGMLIYTDFGYSFDSNNYTHSTTEGPADHLTRRYSAPEVIEAGSKNSRSDVFSLGCVFIDIFRLMNCRPRVDPAESFSHVIDLLHTQILSTATTAMLDILPATIVGMTALENLARLCSTHATAYLLQRSNLRCNQCASSPIDEWIERVRGDDCPPLQTDDPTLGIQRSITQTAISSLDTHPTGPARTTSTHAITSQHIAQTRYFWDAKYNRYQIQTYDNMTRK